MSETNNTNNQNLQNSETGPATVSQGEWGPKYEPKDTASPEAVLGAARVAQATAEEVHENMTAYDKEQLHGSTKTMLGIGEMAVGDNQLGAMSEMPTPNVITLPPEAIREMPSQSTGNPQSDGQYT